MFTFRTALVATALVLATVLVPIDTALAAPFFSDDFSTDPNGSPSWTAYRNGPSTGTCVHSAGAVALTEAENSRACALVASAQLPSTNWVATLRFRIDSRYGADGLAFFFYKDTAAYAAYGVDTGGSLGLRGAGGQPIAGYAVAFDEYAGRAGLVQGTTFLSQVWGDPWANGEWHTLSITVQPGCAETLEVELDGIPLFVSGESFDTTHRGFGVSAATGGLNSRHSVDDLVVVAQEPGCRAAPPTDFTVAPAGPGAIGLSWGKAAGSPDVTEYRIYRSGPDAPEALLATVPGSETSYVDTWVTSSPDGVKGTYVYHVRGANSVGPGGATAKVACSAFSTLLPAPSCAPYAASDPYGVIVVSPTGDATPTSSLCPTTACLSAAVSGTGDARGRLAASGLGNAAGGTAVSLGGNAGHGPCTPVICDLAKVSVLGNSNGLTAASVLGDATGSWAAVTVAGDAKSQTLCFLGACAGVAVSALGHAEGGTVAVGGGDLLP